MQLSNLMIDLSAAISNVYDTIFASLSKISVTHGTADNHRHKILELKAAI